MQFRVHLERPCWPGIPDLQTNLSRWQPIQCAVTGYDLGSNACLNYSACGLLLVTNGDQINRKDDVNSCPSGWKLYAPRSRADFITVKALVPDGDWLYLAGVTKATDGNDGLSSQPMNSASRPQWVTSDNTSWWLRSTSYSEPSGDYTANCYLGYGALPNFAGGEELHIIDNQCSYSNNSYLCQPACNFGSENLNKYLLGCPASAYANYTSLTEARTACCILTDCQGVTQNSVVFTLQSGSILYDSTSGQKSWRKSGVLREGLACWNVAGSPGPAIGAARASAAERTMLAVRKAAWPPKAPSKYTCALQTHQTHLLASRVSARTAPLRIYLEHPGRAGIPDLHTNDDVRYYCSGSRQWKHARHIVAGCRDTGLYTNSSSICKAAVHQGVITNAGGGKVTVKVNASSTYFGATYNNVTTVPYSGSVTAFTLSQGYI
eukprot:g38972.t1